MEGEALPIAHCSGLMLEQTVKEALLKKRREGEEGEEAEEEEEENDISSSFFASVPFVSKPDEKLPRLVLLSGMTSAEAVAIASYWEQFVGSKAPVVAALRPAMVPRRIGDLVLEATLASASANASSEVDRESNSSGGASGSSSRRRGMSIVDAESIREKVRASVEARRATRATGPIQIAIPPRNVGTSSSSSSSPSSPSAAAAAAAADSVGAAVGGGSGKAAEEKKRSSSQQPPAVPEKVRARGFGNSSASNQSSSHISSNSKGRS